MDRGFPNRRLARIVATLTFASAVAACNALLDIPDAVLRGDAGDLDAAVDSTATQSDSGGNDRDALEAQPPGAAEGGGDAPTGCCDGGCPSLATDPENCGACGHSCQGGGCDAGQCGPVVLAGSPTEPRGLKSLYGLVLLGGQLVGTDWYQPMTLVYTTPLDASLPTGTPFYPFPLADGGTPIANGASDQLATDGQKAFFGIYRDDNGWDAGIYSLQLDGAVSKVATTSHMGSVTTDGTYLYWSDGANNLWMANKDGTNPQSIPLQSSYHTQIVAAGGYVFFTAANVLYRASPQSLGSTTAISGSTTVTSFTADGSFLYWVDLNAQRVYRAPLNGTAGVDMTPPGISLDAIMGVHARRRFVPLRVRPRRWRRSAGRLDLPHPEDGAGHLLRHDADEQRRVRRRHTRHHRALLHHLRQRRARLRGTVFGRVEAGEVAGQAGHLRVLKRVPASS